MRSLKSVLIAGSLLVSVSGYAKTYRCEPLAEGRSSENQVSVTVQELEDVTSKVSFGSHYDHVYRVDVTIVETKGARVISERSFEAYATSEDVLYKISAVKKEGVKFYLYLDEFDQAGIEFIGPKGKKREVRLQCK